MRVLDEKPNTEALRMMVISDATPERNGVGAYYQDLVEHLHDHVEHIEFICPTFSNRAWASRWSFPMPGDTTQRLVLPAIRHISQRVRELRPQVIIIATPGPYGLLGARLAARHGAASIVGFHTHFEKLTALYWGHLARFVTRSYFELCNRFLFRSAHVVLANSQEMVQAACRAGAKNVELMGTPIPRAFLETPVVPLSTKISNLLFAGRLAAEKNVDSFLRAAEQLPDLTFFIAGDGPLRSQVESAASHLANLHYLGWLPRSQIQSVLDRIELLLLPSQIESFGTIALEAMARQRLVLVSNQCGILDWPMLRDGVFQAEEGETLIQAIRRITEMPAHTRQDRAYQSMLKARQLNDWNLYNWLSLLARSAPRANHAGPSETARLHLDS